MTGEVTRVTEDNFEKEVLKSKIPVMVDLWADWCGPCKMISPLIDELAAEYKGRLNVAKVNVDNNAGLAAELGVMNIPTVIFFKNGREHKRLIGVNPKRVFEKVIKDLTGG